MTEKWIVVWNSGNECEVHVNKQDAMDRVERLFKTGRDKEEIVVYISTLSYAVSIQLNEMQS